MTQPAKQARLGRGLSALLGDYAGARNAIDTPETASEPQAANALAATEIAIDRIVPNPKQPRRTLSQSPSGLSLTRNVGAAYSDVSP